MQAPYAEPGAPAARRGDHGVRFARLVTFVYFGACGVLGLVHLRLRGATPESLAATLQAWYAEALIFGAAWGLAALIHGLVKGGGGERPPRRRSASASADVLRALQRDRGR